MNDGSRTISRGRRTRSGWYAGSSFRSPLCRLALLSRCSSTPWRRPFGITSACCRITGRTGRS